MRSVLSVLLTLCLLAGGLAGCSPSPAVSTPAPSDTVSLSGTSLPEILARKDDTYAEFLKSSDPGCWASVSCEIQGEASEVCTSEDPQVIDGLYRAVCGIVPGEPYDGPMATDSGLRVEFFPVDGDSVSFYFDCGCPSIDNVLYSCTGYAALRSLVGDVMEASFS